MPVTVEGIAIYFFDKKPQPRDPAPQAKGTKGRECLNNPHHGTSWGSCSALCCSDSRLPRLGEAACLALTTGARHWERERAWPLQEEPRMDTFEPKTVKTSEALKAAADKNHSVEQIV